MTTVEDFIGLLRIFWRVLKKLNLLSANSTKWSNTLKQFVTKLPTNCLREFGHFVGLAHKELISLFFVIGLRMRFSLRNIIYQVVNFKAISCLQIFFQVFERRLLDVLSWRNFAKYHWRELHSIITYYLLKYYLSQSWKTCGTKYSGVD